MNSTIQKIAYQVSKDWKKAKYQKDFFPLIAKSALEKFQAHKDFSLEGFVQQLFKSDKLPPQFSLTESFGEPAVTVWRDENFLIDIYFWVGPRISIHDHSFSGAFTVLKGNSLHIQYDFEMHQNMGELIRLGNVQIKQYSLMREGDTHEIRAGSQFIHQLWHLSHPSISMVIRTHNDSVPQYSYMRPSLAIRFGIELNELPAAALKKVNMLKLLRSLDDSSAEKYMKAFVRQFNRPEAGLYILFLASKNGIGNPELVEEYVKRHPGFKSSRERILESLLTKQNRLPPMWLDVTDEEQRLFIATLSVFTSKNQIFDVLRQYKPKDSADKTIERCMKQLMKIKKWNFKMSDSAFDLFKMKMKGYDESRIYQELSNKYQMSSYGKERARIDDFLNRLNSNSDFLLTSLIV
jgi:hypothetical protein